MGSQYFGQERRSSESYVNDLYLAFTSGATGAVPTTLTRSVGITSIVRNSTGNYTITYDDVYASVLDFSLKVRQASYAAGGACVVQLVGDAIATVATHTLTIQTTNAAGAVVDMASGDVIFGSVSLQTISV